MEFSDRRNFLKFGGVGLAGIVSPQLLAHTSKARKKNKIPKDITILMQGDSITDAGRDKSIQKANDGKSLGRGYAYQISSDLLGAYPEANLNLINRGISGNKVFQLSDRWEEDCLLLKPDVLSILIGVNDFWHSLKDYKGTAEIYEADFRKLLDRTLAILPNIKLIIGEPFAVSGGTAIDGKWFPNFPKYQQAAAKIAEDYKARFIPYQKVFDSALDDAPVSYWCPDGVHPSLAGAYLMKEAWIEAFLKLY